MNSRFWEFYLVRYLAGTIFGILVLWYLFLNHGPEISKSFYNGNLDNYLPKQIYGMLFETTYTLENLNINIDGNDIDLRDKIVFDGYNLGTRNSDGVVTFKQDGLTVLTSVILAIAGFLYMYISSMFILVYHSLRIIIFRGEKSKGIYKFYRSLSQLRARGNFKKTIKTDMGLLKKSEKISYNEIKEFVESYRHLREHGNAFFILLSEILFAAWLILFDFHLSGLIIWFSIGTIAWFIGTYLEIKFVEDTSSSDR
ncbi:hypothetical protein ACHHV8_10845 [Paenibacillus sp. TAB 01]|uniref:hypothetical protein n=1 Tax=Paenibacillus sp. TAB 01 TaxID=3368988 RepID=UPI003752FF96